jgi:hypothetical protein
MKRLMPFIIFVAVIIHGCKKEPYSKPVSVSYESSFSTESRPISIVIEKNHGFVYVANHDPAINDYSSKIQKFNRKGELLNTVVDFTNFSKGKFSRYNPIDFCTDNNSNIYILVQPSQLSGGTWILLGGFCILQFDTNDNFQKEYDFSEFNQLWAPPTIAYSDNSLYVAIGPSLPTNGFIIKRISLVNNQVTDISFQNNTVNIDSLTYMPVSDMAINSEGTIYLTGQAFPTVSTDDISGCHITKFDPQTNQLIRFNSKGRTGIVASMLNNPGLTISDVGNLYLATFYGMSIEVYDKNDEFILQVDLKPIAGINTRPIDIAHFDKHIYIADNQNNIVYIYKEYY